jgi:hypothetical protein
LRTLREHTGNTLGTREIPHSPPTLDENTLGNTWGSKFIQFCAIAKVEVKLDYKPDVAKVFPKIRISSIFLAHLLELLIEIWLFWNFP